MAFPPRRRSRRPPPEAVPYRSPAVAGFHRDRNNPGQPVLPTSREDNCRDPVLLQDDVALDRWRGAVFLVLVDQVGTGGPFADDLKDCHWVVGDRRGGRHRLTNHKGIGIPRTAIDDDFHVRSPWLARLSCQPCVQNLPKIEGDQVMRRGTAGYRVRREPVELVMQLLPFLPREEFRQRHLFLRSSAHAAIRSAAKPVAPAVWAAFSPPRRTRYRRPGRHHASRLSLPASRGPASGPCGSAGRTAQPSILASPSLMRARSLSSMLSCAKARTTGASLMTRAIIRWRGRPT